MILNGRMVAKRIQQQLTQQIQQLPSIPGLGIVVVGNRQDSRLYVSMKQKACQQVGILHRTITLPEKSSEQEVINHIEQLNQCPNIHGILVQLPLPTHIESETILNQISHEKDIDGFHVENVGKLTINSKTPYIQSCTPKGIMRLLDEYNISVKGKHVVVIGKSKIVGFPLSTLLLHEEATVTICHIETKELETHTLQADIVIVAAGCPNLIQPQHIKPDAIVIDVGIHKLTHEGNTVITGDVNYDSVKEKTKAISPVPGGVGPMTISMVLENTLECYKNQVCDS